MYVKIGTTEYRDIRNLKYAPTTDVVALELPINEFSCDIVTTDTIDLGVFAELYDGLDSLWAKYVVMEVSPGIEGKTVHIRAQSETYKLERIKMGNVMYSGTTAGGIIWGMFNLAGISTAYIDTTILNTPIYGYCPEQNCRDRLLWLLLVTNGYIKDFFQGYISIQPVDNTVKVVPETAVFLSPKITQNPTVTAVSARAYTYTQRTPATYEDYVKINTLVYVEEYQEYTWNNPVAPSTAAENIVDITECSLIGNGNYSAILTRLESFVYQTMDLEADVINNRLFMPGELLLIPVGGGRAVQGYVESADFTFGLQARSRLKLKYCGFAA